MTDVTRHQSAAPSDAMRARIAQIKAAFPFRIAVGAVNPATTEELVFTAVTLHRANKLARDGWQVWTTS